MKQKITGIMIVMLLQWGNIVFAQQQRSAEVSYNPNAKSDTSKRSIKSAAVNKIAAATVTINYYSPGVRGRAIWGGLVTYGKVWVSGAHFATNIEIDKDFVVNGVAIQKGKYAIFTIPNKTEWTVIINKKWNQHLTDDYQQSEDIVRIKVKPKQQKLNTERLQYFITDKGNNKGSIVMAWGKLKIGFELSIIK